MSMNSIPDTPEEHQPHRFSGTREEALADARKARLLGEDEPWPDPIPPTTQELYELAAGLRYMVRIRLIPAIASLREALDWYITPSGPGDEAFIDRALSDLAALEHPVFVDTTMELPERLPREYLAAVVDVDRYWH
jgi:hypothetical protein